MSKKAFTVLEIAVICVIVGVLAMLGIPYFQNALESSKDDICATNIEALKKAVEIHVIEQQVVPASLAALPQKYIDRACAQVWQKASWKLKLARFILDWKDPGLAYASTRFPHLRCPKNPDPASVSYGLNRAIAGISAAAYKALAANTIIVGDADNYVADFCTIDTTVIYKGKSDKVKDIVTSVVCLSMGTLIDSRGHVKHGVLGQKEKFLIATTGNEVLLKLVGN
jgi:competence protein ComGC